MKTETKFEYAVLGPGESLCSPDTCDCCGRDGLKKTVKLVHPSGNAVWYGVGCAAKAMSLKNGEVERARKAQTSDLEDSERKSRAVAFHAEQAEWVAFLIRAAGPGEIIDQIARLGGMQAARAMMRAQ